MLWNVAVLSTLILFKVQPHNVANNGPVVVTFQQDMHIFSSKGNTDSNLL